MRVTAFFHDKALEPKVREVMEAYGGVYLGSGTLLATGQRDLEYDFVDRHKGDDVMLALHKIPRVSYVGVPDGSGLRQRV